MPLRVRMYVFACAAASVALCTSIVVQEHRPILWAAALGFGLLSFLAEQFPVELTDGTTYSVGFVLTIAAIITAGPGEAVIATVLGTLSLRNARARSPVRHLFNASQLALSAGLAGYVYGVLGGERVGAAGVSLRGVLLPLLACTLADFLANTLLVSGVIGLSERRSMPSVWVTQYASLVGTYLAFAFLGLLLGALYVEMGLASALFLLMPLLVARHAFRAAITMHGAYDETVQSLMRAIEAKDPYTRGHAQRVSRLAEMTARAYGLSEERCRALRYAAIMHDVGKLTVQSRVLQKPGKLTPDEYEHMKSHPVRGVEIIGDIDLLQEAIDGIRHHHERVDGSGYPDGLVGDAIPLFARLITVCDAFDSMTSTRVYRPPRTIEQALDELRKWEGVMFDSDALAALDRAIARNGWEPAPEGPLPEEDDQSDTQVARLHG